MTKREIVYDWLYGEHGLLHRYEPPQISEAGMRQEVAYLVADIADALRPWVSTDLITVDMTGDDIRATLEAAHRDLRKVWGSRKWPSIRALLEAVEGARADRYRVAAPDIASRIAAAHAARTGRPGRLNTPEVTAILVASGALSMSEARSRGFVVDDQAPALTGG